MSKTTVTRSCIIPVELKEASDLAASELGIGISEYLRLALIHLVNERTIPFAQKRASKPGRATTKPAADQSPVTCG